jgi:hypothetical protein
MASPQIWEISIREDAWDGLNGICVSEPRKGRHGSYREEFEKDERGIRTGNSLHKTGIAAAVAPLTALITPDQKRRRF